MNIFLELLAGSRCCAGFCGSTPGSRLNEVDAFLMRHLSIASFFKDDEFQRIDKPALPVLPVREALINAICHRDYSQKSGSIALAIYDDRLEIWNNGELPKQLTIEDLSGDHLSWPKNALIANVFYSMGWIETWGRGTNRMIETCEAAGLKAPTFRAYSGGVAVTFMLDSVIDAELKLSETVNNELPEKTSASIDRRRSELLRMIQEAGELSTDEIFERMANPPSKRTLQRELNQLAQVGKIEMSGSARAVLWKYLQPK